MISERRARAARRARARAALELAQRHVEFEALLVGPPTTGGLIRHRARRRRGRLLAFVSGVVNALGGWLR